VDRSSAEGSLVEAPMAPRGVGCGEGVSGEGSVEGARPLPRKFLLFYLEMEYFCAAFKLNLTEETRTQLQEEDRQLPTLASDWLRL